MFMRHEAMYIAVQRDHRIFMTEDLRQRFDIHTTLQRAGGKGMPQGVKSAVRDPEPFQMQAEAVLIGSDGLHFVLSDHEGGAGLFLLLPQKRQQLSRDRDHAA